MTTGISLHINVDGCDNALLDRCVLFHQRVQPDTTNVFGAARWNQTFNVIERLQAVSPNTRYILRGWQGERWNENGLSERESAEAVYAVKVQPHEAWLRKTGVYVLFDNETGVGEGYGARQAQWAKLCAQRGIRSAIGRTSTGNPAEDLYARLDPIAAVMEQHKGMILWSPNEYDNPDFALSAGNQRRLLRFWERQPFLRENPHLTTLGEYGIAKIRMVEGKPQMDADHGYGSRAGLPAIAMGEREFARFCIARWKELYRPLGISFSVFCVGLWGNGSYSVGEAFMDEIEKAAARGELEMPSLAAPAPLFAPNTIIGIRPAAEGTNVRSAPNLAAVIKLALKRGVAKARYLREQAASASEPAKRRWVEVQILDDSPDGWSHQGWIASDAAQWLRLWDDTLSPPPPPAPPPVVTPPRIYVDLPEVATDEEDKARLVTQIRWLSAAPFNDAEVKQILSDVATAIEKFKQLA